MKIKKLMILIVLFFWLLFPSNLKLIFQYYQTKREITYNGLLWVGLDHYLIWKYPLGDKPTVKWIQYSKTKV